MLSAKTYGFFAGDRVKSANAVALQDRGHDSCEIEIVFHEEDGRHAAAIECEIDGAIEVVTLARSAYPARHRTRIALARIGERSDDDDGDVARIGVCLELLDDRAADAAVG